MISPLNLEVSVTGETFLLQVDVTYVIDDDCPKAIYTDKRLLIFSIINLLSNACKFTHEGSITCSFKSAETIVPFCRTISDIALLIEVEDTGIGVANASLEFLWGKPFIQEDNGRFGKTSSTESRLF